MHMGDGDTHSISDGAFDWQTCAAHMNENPNFAYSEVGDNRQWRVHTCFSFCREPAEQDNVIISGDNREECTEVDDRLHWMLCVEPDDECEVFTPETQSCFDEAFNLCWDYRLIIMAIAMSNFIQITFELSVDIVFETNLKPIPLDLLLDPDLAIVEDDAFGGSPDSQFEPDCDVVLKKCVSEITAILIYSIMTAILIIGTMLQINGGGKPITALIEFGIAFGID